jgi:hypothetical protein
MAHAATATTTPNPCRAPPRHLLVLARVSSVLAPGADGAGAVDHPMGRRGFERHAEARRALQELRREGRYASAPELERQRYWVGGIPSLKCAGVRSSFVRARTADQSG